MKYYIGSQLDNLEIIPYLRLAGEVVADPAEADILIIPYYWGQVKDNKSYLESFSTLAEKIDKKIIITAPGDSNEEILIPRAIILRNSQYKSSLRSNEIIIPGFADDLLSGRVLEITKKRDRPVIGFCGWANFVSFDKYFRYLVKVLISKLKVLLGDREALVRRQGLWFRRKALKILSASNLVKTNFIIRRSYSGTSKTTELDLKQARAEYIDNMMGSDFVLCVKGDGNFSVRFFEALSLGRIPLLVDTDCPLPLDNLIDYDDFIVRVDYRDLVELPMISSQIYKKWSDAEYEMKQKQARAVFDQYLQIKRFFQMVLSKEYLQSYGI